MTTKISELTSATAIANADEYVINQSGTTKKFSGMEFEEGTWTPSLFGGFGSFLGMGTSTINGYYQRHGNLVHLYCRLNITGVAGVITQNSAIIFYGASLPFTPNLEQTSTGLIFETGANWATFYTYFSSNLYLVADNIYGSPTADNFLYFNLTYEAL